jgi:threonine/homoserine/homoserine lactone efflux protein
MGLPGFLAIGFILGLTGAMAPGPLLTMTIGESAKRGGIVGPLVVVGHSIPEILILLLIVFGLGNVLNNKLLFALIALVGGIVLIYMGYNTLKSLKGYTLSAAINGNRKEIHPVISGVVVSLSNPYWFIWWITIGMGYVMFAKGLGAPGIICFFVGHILSDFVWYCFVSYGVQFGGRFAGIRVIKAVLFVCSVFLIFFGVFFVIRGYGFLQ